MLGDDYSEGLSNTRSVHRCSHVNHRSKFNRRSGDCEGSGSSSCWNREGCRNGCRGCTGLAWSQRDREIHYITASWSWSANSQCSRRRRAASNTRGCNHESESCRCSDCESSCRGCTESSCSDNNRSVCLNCGRRDWEGRGGGTSDYRYCGTDRTNCSVIRRESYYISACRCRGGDRNRSH